MADSTHSGIRDANLPKTIIISSTVMAWIIPATGERPPLFMLVAVRAMAPVAGMPPKIGDTKFAKPWATSSVLESCRVLIIPSATIALKRDSMAQSNAMDNAGENIVRIS